jgi:hypothetical protein
MPAAEATLTTQLVWLFVLATPVACVAWTVTHEEVFAEARDWCVRRSHDSGRLYARKFFYIFTCEYCFSHYVAAAAIAVSGFRLLLAGWVGALIAWLAVVWIANIYMSLFGRLRLDIKRERVEINMEEGHARARDGRVGTPQEFDSKRRTAQRDFR